MARFDDVMPSRDGPTDRGGERLITAAEVAALLCVTKAWVYEQTRNGRLPHVRLGRYVRYRRETIEIWLDGLEARSTR